MLQTLTLPIIWLLFYALGQIPRQRSLGFRRGLVAGASLMLLLLGVGLQTFAFYVALGLLIVLAGVWLGSARDGPGRRLAFLVALGGVVILIAVSLRFRDYLQKFFVLLPSLSYLGFRGIAYLVSAYRERRVQFSGGLMQMFFLPMLFLGPISRVEHFDEEVQDAHREVLQRLAMGFPMLIAGNLCGRFVLDEILRLTDTPWWEFWLGALANSFEFYFTFAGYSHLIIGLGLLVGFRLPENFNHPYIATSIGDFWRRWHMSLSFWIRDYLYIPLGGSRKGLPRKCGNLLFAMGICGIWHGLEMHYLVWGLYHGFLLAVESVMTHWGWKPLQRILGPTYRPVKVALIFSLVTFSWLLFRYRMPEMAAYLKGMVSW